MQDTMFWVGALLALTPILLGLIVAGVILHHRRKQRPAPPPPDE